MFKYYYIDNYDCKTAERGASSINDLISVVSNRNKEYNLIVEEFTANKCVARMTIDRDGSCSVRINSENSDIGYNLHKIADKIGVVDRTVTEMYGMGIDSGEWHDLESVRGVIKCEYKKSEKAYTPTFYYFVEYNKDGFSYRGMTDKKTIIDALVNDVTVHINTIHIRTINTMCFGYITNNDFESVFVFNWCGAGVIDAQWLKWYRKLN